MASMIRIRQSFALVLISIHYSAPQSVCPATSKCRPLAQCSNVYKFNSQRNSCKLENGKTGLCCPDINPLPAKIEIGTRSNSKKILKFPNGITENDVETSLSNIDTNIRKSSSQLKTRKQDGHSVFKKLRPEDRNYVDVALRFSKLKVQLFGLRAGDDDEGFNGDNSNSIKQECAKFYSIRCNPQDKYRKADGSCNNREEPLWGMSRTPLNRILLPEYNGDNLPRVAKSGADLPSARLISTGVLDGPDVRDQQGISAYFVQMGQFIDHDITLSPEIEDVECCKNDSKGRPWIFPSVNDIPDKCTPIQIPDDDPRWRGSRTCFNMPRSAPALQIPDCQAGFHDQMNALTTWLDNSNVYGSNEKDLNDIRVPRSPLLKRNSRLSRVTGRAVLPSCQAVRDEAVSCIGPCADDSDNSRGCILAGDMRANEQPGLTTMHTLWFREHNRIASELEAINRNWDSERVFQETRRIMIAEYQHIIYQEWLPILLGANFMRSKNLSPTTDDYTRNYDPTIDPRINNEFSTAAFRFGHSMVSKEIFARDSNFIDRTRLSLSETFFDIKEFETDSSFVDKTVRGQIVETAQGWDPGFNDDIRNNLFDEKMDLVSLNIQRGREHGIPGYNSYRRMCSSGTYKDVQSFTELNNDGFLSGSDVRSLETHYADVDDIDLFPAGVLEKPHQDALVGPAFKCIIGDQFIRLKEGDRFWYENDDPDTRFTPRQLQEIKKASMARVVCDNTNVDAIQPMVFRTETTVNKVTSCSEIISIPMLDLEAWRE